jgi:hypothetical protein
MDRPSPQYGFLTMLAMAPNGKTMLVGCTCGKVMEMQRGLLGKARSCGCVSPSNNQPLYNIWHRIIARTTNPNDPAWKYYGGRGIGICPQWRGSRRYRHYDGFMAFTKYVAAELGKRPGPKWSIDRIDNDGDYKPGNIRWATAQMQNRNKRNNIYVTWQGQRMLLVDAAEKTGLTITAIKKALRLFRSE